MRKDFVLSENGVQGLRDMVFQQLGEDLKELKALLDLYQNGFPKGH